MLALLALLASCGGPHELIAFRDLNKNGKLDVYDKKKRMLKLQKKIFFLFPFLEILFLHNSS